MVKRCALSPAMPDFGLIAILRCTALATLNRVCNRDEHAGER